MACSLSSATLPHYVNIHEDIWTREYCDYLEITIKAIEETTKNRWNLSSTFPHDQIERSAFHTYWKSIWNRHFLVDYLKTVLIICIQLHMLVCTYYFWIPSKSAFGTSATQARQPGLYDKTPIKINFNNHLWNWVRIVFVCFGKGTRITKASRRGFTHLYFYAQIYLVQWVFFPSGCRHVGGL